MATASRWEQLTHNLAISQAAAEIARKGSKEKKDCFDSSVIKMKEFVREFVEERRQAGGGGS